MLVRFFWILLAWAALRVTRNRAVARLSSRQQGELLRRVADDGSLSWPVRLTARLPWLYRRAPIDLIPDAIPLLGRLDDGVVTAFALRVLTLMAPNQAIARHIRDIEGRR